MEAAMLIVGCLVAFVVSIIAIKFLMGYIKKNDFKVFGYYRIILGVIVLGYFGGKRIFKIIYKRVAIYARKMYK